MPPAARQISARFADLAGRAAIVTGASRGIGVGIAELLARQGMRLVLAARSEPEGLAVVERLRADGADCRWVTADVATRPGARRVLDAAIQAFGGLYLLVNNAAIVCSEPIHEMDQAAFAATFEANSRMAYYLSHETSRHLIETGRPGCVVNISSVGGLRAHRRHAGYDMSKGALDALTRSMALDLAPHGIRVNAVAPGATLRIVPPDERQAAFAERAGPHIPLGRLALPQEIGAAVAFLASDAAAYITGQVLYVDGGLTAQLTPPSIFV